MKRLIYICCFLFALIYPRLSWADNYVIINQVMYDSPLNEIVSLPAASNGEFIELYNAGTETISLQGWKLSGRGETETYVFQEPLNLPASEYLILACRRGETNEFLLSDLYDQLDGTNYTVIYQRKILLANTGETLSLINAQNDTVDQMHYDGIPHLNADNTPGDSCLSLHRTWVEFDADGKVLPAANQWQMEKVTFHSTELPQASYSESFLIGENTLPTGENYVLSITPLDPTSRIDMNDGQPSMCSNIRVRADLVYFDGIGREDELISLGVTPGERDLVTTINYHGKRTASRQWLPVDMETEGQRISLPNVQAQALTNYADDRPFVETLYENYVLKRPILRAQPGEIFEDHEAELCYRHNTANDQVRIYFLNTDNRLQTDGSYYGASTLYKVIFYDEMAKSITTYTDKSGRKIMEERDGHRTYYVYDELGRLRFVLPNLLPSKLSNGTYSLDNPTLKATAYCYGYDERGNMIYKRLPGCEPQYMVYDQLGQLVLKQDGNQRLANKWTMCAYDSLGRDLYTAEVELSQDVIQLINLFADKWQVEYYRADQQGEIHPSGYASSILDPDDINPQLLTVNYYDNYEFLGLFPNTEQQKLSYSQQSGFKAPFDNATGLLTGSRVFNLSEGGGTKNVFYYDASGRVIQSHTLRSVEDYTIVDANYNFDGSISRQRIVQHKADNTQQEQYHYTYDHAGRAKEVFYKLNNDDEIRLSAFSYDTVGRLAQKLLHNNQDTIRYSYDMRNMLTVINNRHFYERLFYADSLPSGVSPCYNGRLSASYIAQNDTAFTTKYTYDNLNRLIDASHLTANGTSVSEQYNYDAVGNISDLKRVNNNKVLDELHYYYGDEGNQIISIEDLGQDADRYDVIEYHNGLSQADTTMRYDANGNLIYDDDRGISVIHYNLLNLPDTIQFITGDQIVNHYDAVGRKYKSIFYTVRTTAITPRYEIMHYTFNTDTVDYTVIEYTGNTELRYTRTDTLSRRIFNSIGYYSDSTYYHYIKDHLGSIRAVVHSAKDSLIQGTIYYASGVPMPQGFGRDKQPYLYNGKEFVEQPGLYNYDFGFRGYYAPIGRFTSIDPLAEQTPWQSPYAYAGNDFINLIDWMGLGGSGAFTTSNPDLIVDLLNYLSWGGSVSDYDPDGWEDITDEVENYALLHGCMFPEDVTYSFCIPGGSGDGYNYLCEAYIIANNKQSLDKIHLQLYKDLSEISEEALYKMVMGDADLIGMVSFGKCNPFYWKGANGKYYTRNLIHTRGGYANSFKLACERINKSKIAKAGRFLSIASAAMAFYDMTQNGVKVGNTIDLMVGIAGMIPAVSIYMATYSTIDLMVVGVSGNSISGLIETGVNYLFY